MKEFTIIQFVEIPFKYEGRIPQLNVLGYIHLTRGQNMLIHIDQDYAKGIVGVINPDVLKSAKEQSDWINAIYIQVLEDVQPEFDLTTGTVTYRCYVRCIIHEEDLP